MLSKLVAIVYCALVLGYFVRFYTVKGFDPVGDLVLSAGILLLGAVLVRGPDTPRSRLTIMMLGMFAVARFVVWRLIYTMNFDSFSSTVASILFMIADVYSASVCLFFSFQSLGDDKETETDLSPDFRPTIDVFIPTYNEPPDVLRRTICGALQIDYPHKNIYVLDDGRREQILQLAEDFGVNYITRPDNRHAKSGNINNALKQTTGQYLLILDADHIPNIWILRNMLPYFERDAKLALVQGAHRFMNPGPYESNLYLDGVLPTEQELFFQIVQPGKDRWNAAFCAGSGCLIKRAVIDELGGIPQRTVVEDLEFSLRMHDLGYNSRYIADPQVVGLNPESLNAYFIQQRRWASGAMQVLSFYNPFTLRNLTWQQRVAYMANILYFLFPVPRLIHVATPMFFLVFGVRPLVSDVFDYLVMATPFLAIYMMYQNRVFKNFRHSLWADTYEILKAPYLAYYTTKAIIFPRRLKFHVTPKGTTRPRIVFNLHLAFPHLVIIAFCLVGVLGGFVQLAMGTEVYAVFLNLGWNLYNIIVLTAALCVCLERPQFRRAHRMRRVIPASITEVAATGKLGASASGESVNINEYGCMLTIFNLKIEKGSEYIVNLENRAGDLIEVRSVAASVKPGPVPNSTNIGFEFDSKDLNPQKVRELVELAYSGNPEWHAFREPGDSLLASIRNLLSTPARLGIIIKRFGPRILFLGPSDLQSKRWVPETIKTKLVDEDQSESAETDGSEAELDADFSAEIRKELSSQASKP